MSATQKSSRRNGNSFEFQRAVAARGVPRRAQLHRWAAAAARGRTEVVLRIVGAREGRALNRAYRSRDYATNVLTFVYSTRPWTGDIVLCHPVLVREAREQGITLEAHYAHLVVHGMLHLRGYDHVKPREAKQMEREETRLLARLGYADPYAVESRAAHSGPRVR